MNTKKSAGRPFTGAAMTPAERQRASRAKRKLQTYDSFPAQQLAIMLSAEATKALRMLCHNRDLSQKELVDTLLVDAYQHQQKP